MDMFSFLLLMTLSTTFGTTLRRSRKYIKAAQEPYAFPVGVCYPKRSGDKRSSIRLECKEECSAPNENNEVECDKNVMSWHYATDDCSGDIMYYDRFTPFDRVRDYPYNCFEDEEFEGNEINSQEYDQNYMILKLSYAKMTTEIINGTEEEVCVKDESKYFYKTFPAITNLCVKGYEGLGNNKRYYWYNAACTKDVAYLERWTEFNCTGEQTGMFPVYKPNGCNKKKWMGKYWYTEVINCTHPDYTIGYGFRNCNNIIIAIIFIIIVTLYNQ